MNDFIYLHADGDDDADETTRLSTTKTMTDDGGPSTMLMAANLLLTTTTSKVDKDVENDDDVEYAEITATTADIGGIGDFR